MHRNALRKYFKTTGPAVLPVIHVVDNAQTDCNVALATAEGAAGVFLINHDFGVEPFLPIIRRVREHHPALWLGVNFLGVTGKDAFPVLARLEAEGCTVDAYWADNARVDEHAAAEEQTEAKEIEAVRRDCGWDGMYFGGTAFKKQRPVAEDDYVSAARIASAYMDAVTTSGVATGKEAQRGKIRAFRSGVADGALALASGVTPDNIHEYSADVDAVLVATGINAAGDFYNIDRLKLRLLMARARQETPDRGETGDRDHRWYLDLMAPRSRSEKYAWLDPSSAYINADSFNAMLDDLLEPFAPDEIDVVAGFDAAGFVLGAAMATRLGKGFLTIRKGGKVPVHFDSVPMTNYSGQTESMEMRKPAFAAGTRVLLVDQWIETGGTMSAGISLVQRQDGIVAGIAAVCIEQNEVTRAMYERYKMVSCVVPGSEIQAQCNRQKLESFEAFTPEKAFPSIGRNQ